LKEEVICYRCGGQAEDDVEVRCSRCGGPLTVSYERSFAVAGIRRSISSMWRYMRFLPPSLSAKPITLGEGFTPIAKILGQEIYVKLDYLTPTGSFKDRGSSALLSHYLGRRATVKTLVEDSSGNAGASLAAYAAYAGLDCIIYVQRGAGPLKLSQITAYGGHVLTVDGGREDVMRAAQEAAREAGYLYVGHSWNPYFIEGMTTMAFEIAEQMEWNPPDRIYVPTSAGTLLLGLLRGFNTLHAAGVIAGLPKILAVQPMANAPLYHAFKGLERPAPQPSVADALSFTDPPRLEQMVRELRIAGGDVVAVSEDEILRAYRELAISGIYVEPSAAVGYAALRRELDTIVSSGISVLTIATGSGLKRPIGLK